MKLFLYTYTNNAAENFKITKEYGVFGGKKRYWQLHRDDLILIRDGSKNDELTLFGCCRVTGEGFDQRSSPYRDLLWADEVKSNKVVYPFRIAVDFETAPKLSHLRIPWIKLENQTKYLHSKRDWMMKFRDSYIREDELKVFLNLFLKHAGDQ